MAKYVLELEVTDKGTNLKVVNKIKATGAEVDKLASSHKRAGAAADDHFHRQAKGIAGTANSTKSFSKLAQSINGDNNSLVGAYAALAANIFAVTAAFGALKSAAEVEQVIEGLAASGARLGLSYKNAITEVRNASEGLLTLEQSARSTAQVLSAGFNSDQLVRITKAAKDASFALGRDMTESMDRLTRGVIKLEPELLDELGIMVRLDEASATYARSLGKSTSALTSAEKRQGFFNAAMAEVDAKFGGLAEGADTSAAALNKLATVFGDLSKTIFSTLNLVFVPFAKLFSSSPVALLGGMLLFASSIKGQLMPVLTDAADRMQTLAEKSSKLSGITASNIITNAKGSAAKSQDKAVNDYFIAVQNGAGSLEETRQMQEKLNKAIEDNSKKTSKNAKEKVESYKKQLDGLKNVEVSQLQTAAITNQANAANAASMGKYSSAISFTGAAIQDYAAHVGAANTKTGILGTVSRSTSIGMFALGAAAKTAGIAFLTFLPYLGLIVVALGLLYTGIKKLAGEGYARLTEATKAYNEVIKTASKSLEQYNKLNTSTASMFTITTEKAVIAGNSITSMAAALRDMNEAQKNNTGFGKFIEYLKSLVNIGQSDKLVFTTMAKTGISEKDIRNNYALIETFEKMSKYGTAGGLIEKAFGKGGPKTIEDYKKAVALLENAFKSLSSVIESVREAFKGLDIAAADFIKAATPSTPYDAMTSSLQGATSSMSKYVEEVGKGTQNSEDLIATLSGLGPSISQFLSPGSADTLQTYRDVTAEIQRVKALGDDATKADKASLAIQQEKLPTLQSQGVKLLDNLNTVRAEFEVLQNNSIEQQGQLALAQARLTVVGRSTAITKAESEAKIDAENAVIGLQVSQLKAQANILRSIALQNEEKQKLIDKEKELIGLGGVIDEQAKLQINNEKILLLSKSNDFFAKGSIEIYEEQNKALRKSINLKIEGARVQAGINNLENQAAALAMTAKTAAQQTAETNKNTADAEVFKSQQLLKVRESLVAEKLHEANIQEIIFGLSDKGAVLEEARLAVYEQQLDLAKKESAARQAEYLVQASLSQSSTNRAAFEERARQEREDLLPLIEKELKMEFDLRRLKDAGFKSEVERLSTAKNLLDIQLQQAEAVASAAEAQTALNIRQKKFEAGSRQLTATEERQLAFEAAEAALDAALATQELKAKGIKAEYALLDAQYALEMIKLDNTTKALARLKPSLSGDELVAADANIVTNMQALDAYAAIRKNLGAQETAALDLLGINIANLRLAVQETGTVEALSGQARTFSATQSLGGSLVPDQDGQLIRAGSNLGFNKETILALSEDLSPFIEDLKKLGPQGEYVSAVVEGALIIADSFRRIGEEGLTSAEGLSAVGSIIGQVAKIAQSSAQAKIAAVDQEIAAEQKRDGKSSESLARIKAMEAKKDAMAKKAFEMNKKLMIAQAIVSTAAGMMGALSTTNGFDFPIRVAMAAMIGAMGAAQIGIIAGTQYQSSASSSASAASPSAISVGSRGNSVDLARNNTNVGGELGYLQGNQGTGTGSSNFRNRAYGGYGHAGMIVGEKGPELFVPSTPGHVVANDNANVPAQVSATFNINAIDAEGVEQVLSNQKGHIIGMIREAANANGQNFLERVNTEKYRRGGRRL